MNNNLTIFKNEDFGEIRAMVIDSEPWFVGKDIALALGFSNTRDAIKTHVDEEDKGRRKIDTLGGKQEMVIVNESGLYALTFGSQLSKAKEFKHWVTKEIVPSVRKHGMYATDELLDNPDFLIKVLQELKEEREEKKKLELQNNIKTQQINELKPKADYTDLILKSKSLVTITQIAKDYGFSGKRMNEILHDLKVQYKQSGQWLLYSEYQDKGYTHSETIHIEKSNGKSDIKMNTKWTQKGRLFLYELLKSKDIYPTIECGLN